MADKIVFKAFRGKKAEMPVKYHDGYIYYTTDEGKLYIDTKQDDGSIKRQVVSGGDGGGASGGVVSDTT